MDLRPKSNEELRKPLPDFIKIIDKLNEMLFYKERR